MGTDMLVWCSMQGYVKIGDFGFAKVLESSNRTYTFCGTPGYVAPENGEQQRWPWCHICTTNRLCCPASATTRHGALVHWAGPQTALTCHLGNALPVLLCLPYAVLAHGYNYSVDWWGLGVLTYVLLTGRQPFSSPKTDDPMVVMRRIVDENYTIKYPVFLSHHAKVGWAQLGFRVSAIAVCTQLAP